MHAFEALLLILIGAVLLSLLARRLNAPFPPFLALGGAAVAFLPWAPELTLDPELVLALFVAPVLLDAAFDSSPRDLKRNAVPIIFLTIVAVGVTVVAVALAARALEPSMAWPVAIALGAIVAPPDAAAATSVLRAVPVPHRVRVVLEGESLFNDATSLLTYRLAVTAATAGLVVGWPLVAMLVWMVIGSVILGVAAGWLASQINGRIEDAPLAILTQFIFTFGVWLIAEQVQVSAIITVVVYGLVAARLSARRSSAALRVPSYAVWETAVFALNATAFAIVGLQIGPIWRALEPGQRSEYAVFALIILGVAVAARLAWVMTYNVAAQIKNRTVGANPPGGQAPPTLKTGLVVGWSGMRGVVSLATAYALPDNFPHRDLILLATFAVVLGTLSIQGLTLGPLIRLLKIRDDGQLAREVHLARKTVLDAGLGHVSKTEGAIAARLRADYAERMTALEKASPEDGRIFSEQDRLLGAVLEAKREALVDLRMSGRISDAAYFQLEEELDRMELSLTPVVR
ncbi:sodium:proton antiporter [Brevundimonas sp. NIBR11]|uniref:cation:proton antiporter n=1 Tax=Brevundimonas sp. NIBR11 TaxID=3015999 RepID=UPI0022F10674|nr:sodium:proton antiporter [Brevundimonas sp. NIBR11]WGM30694.1 Sodium, potassium, lithium and rubidium/H(+) antiporter [Brevundimonas sp. NIBR11]